MSKVYILFIFWLAIFLASTAHAEKRLPPPYVARVEQPLSPPDTASTKKRLSPSYKVHAKKPLRPYLSFYVGPITSKGNIHTYKAWGISYVYRSQSPWGWSYSYSNEGHITDHYRDGVSLQITAHAEPFTPNWSF